MRAASRQERTIRYLSVELRSPAPRQRRLTRRTTAIRTQPVILDEVVPPLDHRIPAVVAPRILVLANHPRQVPRINVAQSSLLSDLYGLQQVLRPCVLGR